MSDAIETTVDAAWQEVVTAHPHHIFADFEQDGVRVLIRRGSFSLCAYIGVPASHPWWGKEYGEIDGQVDCHGGLSFSETGDGKDWPAGWHWFGLDFAHAGDYATYYDLPSLRAMRSSHSLFDNDHKWTVPEVITEARAVAAQFVAAARA